MLKSYLRQLQRKIIGLDKQENIVLETVRRQWLEDKMLNCNISGVSSERYGNCDVIVSLTSYGSRLSTVCYAIESIMQQVVKANRIVLWLGENDFKDKIPLVLRKQVERGLEIKCTKDIRSYTKIIPSLNAFPDSAIITIDDDIMYDFDVVGNLICSYLEKPTDIHACRCHIIKYDSHGRILPYLKWGWNSFDYSDNQKNFFTGVGGVLYPPNCFDTEVLNDKVFLDICKTADDVWLNAMARKAHTNVRKVRTKNKSGVDYVELSTTQDVGLRNVNIGVDGLNDKCISLVFEKYGLL